MKAQFIVSSNTSYGPKKESRSQDEMVLERVPSTYVIGNNSYLYLRTLIFFPRGNGICAILTHFYHFCRDDNYFQTRSYYIE